MNEQLFVKMALNGWNQQVARAEKFFNGLTDEDFQKRIAPDKNRILYLYGHLTAYHDLLKETLGIGARTYPDLTAIYLHNPDNPIAVAPSLDELKRYWEEVHSQLTVLFYNLTPAEWFARHNVMTDDDFAADPSRNRLSVLLSRTNHIAYHYGQLILA